MTQKDRKRLQATVNKIRHQRLTKDCVSDRIRRLDSLAQDRLTTRQQAGALAAAISYFAHLCERDTKHGNEEIYDCLETALQWADGNHPK